MYRSFLTVLLVALLVGCAKPDFVSSPGTSTAVAFDFSKYQEKGFLITPQRYRGDYNSVGQITLSIMPAVEEKATEGIASDNAAESDSLYSKGVLQIERVTTDRLVEQAYQKASEMGADAIVNFDVTTQPETINPARSGGSVTVNRYEVRGFAIDRE